MRIKKYTYTNFQNLKSKIEVLTLQEPSKINLHYTLSKIIVVPYFYIVLKKVIDVNHSRTSL